LQSKIENLKELLQVHERVLVISGAGISTNSGIGDYRDQNGDWKRVQPVKHQAFMAGHEWRQRYWGRSQLGYPSFLQAQPNEGHRALAQLEKQDSVFALITQNVDRLHQKAGQQTVIDLHGRLDQVICTACGRLEARDDIQLWLEAHNPSLQAEKFVPAPDGDADLEVEFAQIQVPSCSFCDGILKPHVVFFGDSVPKSVVEQAYSWVDQADAVLVVGSSLMVYSSYRFVRRASELAIPIAAINNGVTRADALFDMKVSGDCSELLSLLV
jgi:NAD-dependent SIR2 family protein deacetylase